MKKIFFVAMAILMSLHLQLSAGTLIETVYDYGKAQVVQFEDKGLAHFSYAIIVGNSITLVDPARNPEPYYALAEKMNASITGIIETHPHADFVSSHLEIQQETGAVIFVSSLVGATYPHESFDDEDVIQISETVELRAIHTPGHSPDGISIVLVINGKDVVIFTGDTLFVGDVGRPDLRESVGNITAKREALARAMYRSTREKLMVLEDDVIVLPAHGSGSLCGKALGDAQWSTIGKEKAENYALQDMSEDLFVEILLADQPFIPVYFPYDVDLNKAGAPGLQVSLDSIERIGNNFQPEGDFLVIDARTPALFATGHLKGAINIPDGGKFETWLGSVVKPSERFYLTAESWEKLDALLLKTGKIGYDLLIEGAFVYNKTEDQVPQAFDASKFSADDDRYTIVDVRNRSEISSEVFPNTIVIPLPELREKLADIPTNKPVLIHCASGYRSAVARSILLGQLPDLEVYDFGPAIKDFLK
jgi:hydroxyacylglutathione hydrolase